MVRAQQTLRGRALNRALLQRQLLLDRHRLTVPAALDRMGGLQAQYAPAMYLGLWSRVDGLRRADVTAALEQRTAIQGTLLRNTIHLVSAADYWPVAVAIRAARLEAYLRATRPHVSAAEVAEAAARLRAALADGPLRRADIDRAVGRSVLAAGSAALDLVRVPPSGTWERRRADLFGLAEQWLQPVPVTALEGIDLLVRRYLGGFGPATRADIANWAGLPVADVTAALDRIGPRRYRGESGAHLVDLPEADLPDPRTPAPVRFLPVWDATLLVHARRAGILPEEYRPRIFSTKYPHSFNTFLVDGSVAGTWRYDSGRILMQEFHPLPPSVWRDLDAEAARLAAFHA